jgi:hypothetical protein
MHREIRGLSSTSGGLAQASERDAAADQGPGSGRAFDDQPAFKPARWSPKSLPTYVGTGEDVGPRDLRLRWFSCD